MSTLRERYSRLLDEAGLASYSEFVDKRTKDYIKGVVANTSDPDLRDFVGRSRVDVLEDFQAAFEELELPALDKNIFFGFFPTPTLNAETVDLGSEGYLVLLHGGLFGLISAAVEAVVYSSFSHTQDGRRVPPQMSLEEAAEMLRRAVEVVQKGAGGTGVDPLPSNWSELLWTIRVVNAAQSFVAVHEWAHAKCGHFKEASAVRLATPSGEVWVSRGRIEQEWEADRVAGEWVVRRTEQLRRKLSEADRPVVLPPVLAGPIVVLMLISWSEEGEHLPRVVTHPPGVERLRALEERLRGKMEGTLEWQRAWNFVSHLEALGNACGLTGTQMFALSERPKDGRYLEILRREDGAELRYPRSDEGPPESRSG